MQELITSLFGRYDGNPILVIGGGPSVNEDLPRLVADGFKPACVISANEHGFMQSAFPVDFAVNVDKHHCALKRHMAEILRPFGKPIINRHSWADYRLPEWTFSGNTGLTAIAVACVLGGDPVVPIGIDFWSSGRHYFHKPYELTKREQRWMASRKAPSGPDRRLRNLMQFARGATIRPVSGPLLTAFPAGNPTHPVAYRERIAQLPWSHYVAQRCFSFSGNLDRVQAGAVLALTEKEAAPLLRRGYVQKCPCTKNTCS